MIYIKIFLLFLFLGFNPHVFAATVEASGMGDTKSIALTDALRNAVSQGAGLKLTSMTAVKNFELEADKIVSGTSGIVRTYKVIRSKREEGLYNITVRAVVDKIQAQKTFRQFMEDTNTQKIFQKQTFENRRVAVVYNQDRMDNLTEDSKGIQTLLTQLRDQLASKGFRVFMQKQLRALRNRDNSGILDKKTIINAARDAGAEVLVMVQLEAGKRQVSDGYINIWADMTFEMIEPATAAFIASVNQRGKTISNAGSYAIDDGIARIAVKYGKVAGDKLIQKIVEYLSGASQKSVTVVFRNVDDEIQDEALDILEGDLSWEVNVPMQTGTMMEVEIFEKDLRTVRRKLSRALRKKGIRLKRSIVGHRIIYESK
ncbi:MAG: hypothetical protein HN826_15510 [Methylococcales bacterium]|jgi:hypothetical protein|nr:hypothetical protein [Methylococcales bacterium]